MRHTTAETGQNEKALSKRPNMLRDLLLMMLSAATGFLVIYLRGVSHRPEEGEVYSLIWPVASLSFMAYAAFLCVFLPILHFGYTFPAYFARGWIGKPLRMLMKLILVTFPYFLLNNNVAYYVQTETGHYLVQNDGDWYEIHSPILTADIGGKGFKTYRWVLPEQMKSFAFLEAELPILPINQAYSPGEPYQPSQEMIEALNKIAPVGSSTP